MCRFPTLELPRSGSKGVISGLCSHPVCLYLFLEPVSKRFSLFKVKEGDPPQADRGLKFEPDAEIGQISADFEMGRFETGSRFFYFNPE